MITDDYGSGGTADFDYGGDDYYSHISDADNGSGRQVRYNPMFALVDVYGLKIKLGAVVGWCKELWSGFRLLYWKRFDFQKKCSQVISRIPIIYFSGFCSRHRGLHWNWRKV